MKYVDRKGTNCGKWDGLKGEFGEEGLLPMWVADMDFECPSCAVEALHNYVSNPLGYFEIPDSYYEAVMQWEKEHHGYEVKREWISITPGIVPAIYWAVRVFTKPEDGVLICTPVYYPFMSAVENCEDRRLIKSDLKKVGMRYEMDYERFERDIVQNNVTMFIMCNPHNPVGRVWTAEELRQTLDICKRHNVMVISDEIHQDIVNPKLGRKKITAATVGNYDDILITMASGSKTFNLAAVQNSFIIIPNQKNREVYRNFLKQLWLNDTNGFGCVAMEAAMRGGEAWLNDCLETIYGNFEYLKERFAKECPKVKISELEGTYLVWMDFGAFCTNADEVKSLIQGKCRLALDFGEWFGGDSDTFARMNVATSRENVKEACDRIINALK